jgi:hypothetical protein
MRKPNGVARRSVILAGAIMVLVFVGAYVAWACTNLATLDSKPSAAPPGDKVTITGQNFASDGSRVAIRFNSLHGPVLATAVPKADGSFTATIQVPDVKSGQYVLIATQDAKPGHGGMTGNGAGGPAFGTPARLAFGVEGPDGSVAAPPAAPPAGRAPASLATTSNSSSLGTTLLIVVGAVGALLFLGGLAAFVAEVRRRGVGVRASRG